MTKLKSSKNILFVVLAAFLLVALAITGFTVSMPTKADDEAVALERSVSSTIKVSASRRVEEGDVTSGADLPAETNNIHTYDQIDVDTFAWSKIGVFKLAYQAGETIDPVDNKFNYEFKVQFLRKDASVDGTFGSGENSTFQDKSITTGSVDALSKIPQINYAVDAVDQEGVYNNDFGWGIYRFNLIINGTNHFSQLYFVQPTQVETNWTLTLAEPKKVPALSSLESAYEFTLAEEDYKFVDPALIRWYAYGEGSDGKNYVLHTEDIGKSVASADAAVYTTALKTEAIVRTGSTFKLETSVAGKWHVYCEVYQTAPASTAAAESMQALKTTKADYKSVETGKPISRSLVIWIIVGCGVVLLGVIILIIVKSVKKEKVW